MLTQAEIEKAFDERFSSEIKEKLHRARVAIAGLGGLGSNIALMLARSGVGELLLVDFDRVDITNLNRQMYRASHIGMYKTDAIVDMIQEINPYIHVKTCCEKVTDQNAQDIFAGYTIVCEAFDLADQKTMLISALLSQCPEMTIVSGNGMSGYADSNLIQTTQKMRRLYVCGDLQSDVGEGCGLMAPRVAICAGHQANKVIQLILEKG